jgi:hypothetical protein
MAQDMPVAVGHAVYAVGDGTIIESKPDSGYGGVFVLLHKTGDGQYFKAVYGHIYRGSGLSVGSKVKAGQIIGRVNSARHLHFGIHPGTAYPPDNNPFRGHTYTSTTTYGWTDPVAYLRKHPRTLAYKAPALPLIGTFDTTGTPTVLGIADGRAYWSIPGDADTQVFSRSLNGTAAPEPAAVVPATFETAGFPAVSTTSTFSLYDARPRISIDRSTHVPNWGSAVRISGCLANAAGRPFIGARLVLQRSVDGGPWSTVATVTSGLTGTYSFSFTPKRRQVIRARFAAPAVYVPAESRCITIAPRPCVSAPAVPSAPYHARALTARGTLYPRHTAGAGATLLHVQKKVGGVWVDRPSAKTTYHDCDDGTAYSASLRLPAGTWRVRAETPADDRHASKTTSWTGFTVR